MKLNTKGFAAVEAVLIIGIALIIGGTGYYVYHSNKQSDSLLKTSPTKNNGQAVGKGGISKAKKEPASEVYIIPEWKVSATIPTPPKTSALIQYTIDNSGQPQVAKFTTQELLDSSSNCTSDNFPAGIISRAPAGATFYLPDGTPSGKTVERALTGGDYQPYKKVDNYYYWYAGPHSACGSTSQNQQLQQAAIAEVKQIVSHLTSQ